MSIVRAVTSLGTRIEKSTEAFLMNFGLLFLRVGLGSMMMTHGWSKLTAFSQKAEFFPDPLGIGNTMSLVLAIFSEFFCSILLVLGLLTRFSAFNLFVTMFVAGVIFHANDGFAKQELALVYGCGFLALMLCGGGGIALDRFIVKRD